MNFRNPLLIICLFSLSFSVLGQNTNNVNLESHYIEVIGEKEIEIIPDEIYIGIEMREVTIDKVKITILEQEEKLKTTLKVIGIDLIYLSLSDANSNYITSRWSWKAKDEIVTKKYILKVSDARTVGLVFQELEKIEVEDVFISKVSHSKIEELKKEARITAIKAAKEKADYLLLAIGEQTGKPLIISENIPEYYLESNKNLEYSKLKFGRNSVKGIVNNEEVIQFAKMKIYMAMYVKFEIK